MGKFASWPNGTFSRFWILFPSRMLLRPVLAAVAAPARSSRAPLRRPSALIAFSSCRPRSLVTTVRPPRLAFSASASDHGAPSSTPPRGTSLRQPRLTAPTELSQLVAAMHPTTPTTAAGGANSPPAVRAQSSKEAAPCPGCGAVLQCVDEAAPGFVSEAAVHRYQQRATAADELLVFGGAVVSSSVNVSTTTTTTSSKSSSSSRSAADAARTSPALQLDSAELRELETAALVDSSRQSRSNAKLAAQLEAAAASKRTLLCQRCHSLRHNRALPVDAAQQALSSVHTMENLTELVG